MAVGRASTARAVRSRRGGHRILVTPGDLPLGASGKAPLIDRNALPLDFLQIMALAAPIAHLVQTAMGDTIWSPTAVVWDPFVVRALERVHGFYGANFVSVEPGGVEAPTKDHGWYPEGQAAADALFERVLRP